MAAIMSMIRVLHSPPGNYMFTVNHIETLEKDVKYIQS